MRSHNLIPLVGQARSLYNPCSGLRMEIDVMSESYNKSFWDYTVLNALVFTCIQRRVNAQEPLTALRRSSRQGCKPAGESPAVSVARVG